MKKFLIPLALFSFFFLTGCGNPVSQIFKEEPLAFAENVTISEELIILEFTPNREKASTYEVKYSIQETEGDTVNETQIMEGISEGAPITITIDDLKEGSAYFTGIVIKDEEGNEVHKYQEKIEQEK